MFDFLGKYKNIVLIAIISFVVFIVLRNFVSTDSGQDSLLVTEGPVKSDISRDFVTLLLQLNSLELDESLFKDEFFQSLQDFGTEISPQPYGKENPFAPLDSRGALTLIGTSTNIPMSISTSTSTPSGF